jgi:phosphate transport system protein
MVFSKKQHTDKSFDTELNGLREKLLMLGGKVESEIAAGVRSLIERDSKLAEDVLLADREVNVLEVEIDETCRRLLALRQPAASDLRFITTALKIVVDLERIGDLAVNVAERAIDLNQSPPLRPVHDLVRLAELCQKQVRRAGRRALSHALQ